MTATSASPQPGLNITASNFGWHYPGREAPAFSGLTFTIQPGQKVLLLGHSGAGKTTLLHAIAGLLHDPDGQSATGTLTIGGQPALQGRLPAGLMQQDPESSVVLARLGDDVAFGPENLGLPRPQIWQRVTEALTAVGLNHLPLDHPTSALSGGQKQRLGLAGILAMRPGLILLDEPTANLDPAGVLEVRDAVLAARQASGSTLIVIEHRVGIWAEHMDRIIVLGPQGITHDGTPQEVLTAARQELIQAGVWVPNYTPHLPAVSPTPGPTLLETNNLTTTRTLPRKKDIRARKRALSTTTDPTPHPLPLPPTNTTPNLHIRAGEHLAITGPNGSGKSTLALTLAGLLYPADGTVAATPALRAPTSDNTTTPTWDPTTWDPAQLITRIGYVFQEPEHQFLTPTVRAELEFGPRRAAKLTRTPINEDHLRTTTDQLLHQLRLTHLAQANPFTLSGGEKRRLSVATALATNPRVLILDEPTFGQDATTWAHLVTLFRDLLTQGTAIISVTHDTDFIQALGGRTITLGPSA